MTNPPPAPETPPAKVQMDGKEVGPPEADALQSWLEQNKALLSGEEKARVRQALSHVRYRLMLSPDPAVAPIVPTALLVTLIGIVCNLLLVLSLTHAAKGGSAWTSAEPDLEVVVSEVTFWVAGPAVVMMLSTGVLALRGAMLARLVCMLAGLAALLHLVAATLLFIYTYGDEAFVAMLIGTCCTVAFTVAWTQGGKRVGLAGTQPAGRMFYEKAAQLRADAKASEAALALAQDIEELTLASSTSNKALPKGYRMAEDILRSRLEALRPELDALNTLESIETDFASALKVARPPKALFLTWGCIIVVGSAIALIIPSAYILW